jgi:hypothetical protein
MVFRRRGQDSELEHRLSAERPRPPDDLVSRLTGQIEPPIGPRRAPVSRIAVIAAATAAIALSLGVAGAIGSATGSIHSFGLGVLHVVHAPKSPPASVTSNWSGTHDPGILPGRIHDLTIPPWGWQYGIKVPVCYMGHIKFVPLSKLFWWLTHGAEPVWACFRPR